MLRAFIAFAALCAVSFAPAFAAPPQPKPQADPFATPEAIQHWIKNYRAAPDSKPYDDKLFRLAELLGAVQYLRELCGGSDGQQWRDRMKELIDSESSSALRRARLTRSFNSGYQSYSRTYSSCSPSAQAVINKFLAEGAQIADGLAKNVP